MGDRFLFFQLSHIGSQIDSQIANICFYLCCGMNKYMPHKGRKHAGLYKKMHFFKVGILHALYNVTLKIRVNLAN